MAERIMVLVHGAWHGGWCWGRVRPHLEAAGFRVLTPTQTGLGERAHLLSPAIDLPVFAEDIARIFVMENLRDVVLVGHSFAGAAISAVADRMADRLARLVYLDALLVEAGETPMSRMPPQTASERLRASQDFDAGLSMPVPAPAAFGVTDPDDVAWLAGRLTPHPLRTFLTALDFAHPLGNGVPAAYVACTQPLYGPLATSRQRARDKGWPIHEIATGHDAMVTAPRALCDLLIELAG